MHSEEVERRENLERVLEERGQHIDVLVETISDLNNTLQSFHERGTQPREEELALFRHDVLITRYGMVWHINPECGHLRHTTAQTYRPCINCVGRQD